MVHIVYVFVYPRVAWGWHAISIYLRLVDILLGGFIIIHPCSCDYNHEAVRNGDHLMLSAIQGCATGCEARPESTWSQSYFWHGYYHISP